MILHVPERIESTPISRVDENVAIRWTPPAAHLRSLIFVLPHPLPPAASKAFFAGSFDLLVKRFEVGPQVDAAWFKLPDSRGEFHVVVLAQTQADTLVFVSDVGVVQLCDGMLALGSLDFAEEGFNPSPLTSATNRFISTGEADSHDGGLVGLGTTADPPQEKTVGAKVVVSSRTVPTGSLVSPAPTSARIGDENFDLQRELKQRTAAYLRSTRTTGKH
ncbi:MAG: hypothetical protein HUU55_15780 [Myxococcales bacterium]|nr:hypothetical protein [Myxococcales bacterium]